MTDDELLKEAQKRFGKASTAERENRQNFIDDLNFYAGEQWPDKVKRDRELQDRACLTVNRMPQFVRQVTNDQRQNRPSVKVRPVDDKADVQTAEVLTGLVRHIESNSAADIAYDNAFFYSVAGGFGYYRVVTDYCNEYTFDQDILIKQIPNPLTVYPDPDSREPDGSDWEYCFVTEEMPKEAFEKLYPGKSEGWPTANGDNERWITDDTVRLAEYWYSIKVKKTLVLLANGSTMLEDEYKARGSVEVIMDKRPTEVKQVKWAKLGGHSVLDKGDWAGRFIPVIPVYGDAIEIDGKRSLLSLIRFAKDPQRMLNYYRSTETELLALQPKAPFIVAEGQIEGYEDVWAMANTANYAYLPYKPTTIAGQAVGAPQRQGFASVPTGVQQGAANAQSDLMSTTGIYESSLGMKSNEQSGRAILARQREGDTATFHFIDNMTKSIRQCGRILVDLIPKIYDTPRILRILGEDGKEDMKAVNQPVVDKDELGQAIQRIYDLRVGEYDVVVSAGPSYNTKREEAAASMMQMLQSAPQLMGIAGDIIVKAMDWPGAEELAKRIEKSLPPQLKDDKQGQPQLPPQVQQQMEQHEKLIQALDKTVEQMSEELESKEIERRKLDIDAYNAETQRLKVEADAALKMQAQGAPDLVGDIAEVKTMLVDIMRNAGHLDHLMQEPPELEQAEPMQESPEAEAAEVPQMVYQQPEPELPEEPNEFTRPAM